MTAISSSFTAAQATVLKSLFSGADKNSDSLVTKTEAEAARKKLPSTMSLAGSSLATAFSKLDANRDNRISTAEFAALLGEQEIPSEPPAPTGPAPSEPAGPSTPPAADASARMQMLLAGAIDKNGDSAFTKDELEVGRKKLAKSVAISGSELADAFTLADADKNKKLSLAEITVLLATRRETDDTPEVPVGQAPSAGGSNGASGGSAGGAAGGAVGESGGNAGSGQGSVQIPTPFPQTGPYATDKLGAITAFGMKGEPQSAEKPYSINYADGVLRIEAHQGDRRQKASEANRAIERSEVSFPANPFKFGETYNISFDMMFQGSGESSADNDKFFQIHNVNDPGDASLGPIFAMQLEGDRMRIVTRSDPDATTTSRVKDNWIYEDTADIERDHWYKFDITLRVDPFGNGQVTVSRDGQEIANYEGAIGYNDAKPPYAKVGIYRDSSKEPQTRIYKDLKFEEM